MKTLIENKTRGLVEENFNLLRDLPYDRKTEFYYTTAKVNFNKLSYYQKNAIRTLTVVETKKEAFDNLYPKSQDENEFIYLVKTQGKLFLVNNEGFQYSRYVLELTNVEYYKVPQSFDERLDEMANEITKEIIEKLYKVTDYHLSHSDLDVEGDDYNNASSRIMDLVIKKIKK